ncbi:MAG: T9SS type A sorting domain-containing protein [Bacteroidetes bacterium]|nr:T9SS type A sorting domain-containing protein [Bacteroidota bacterium]
MQDANIDVSDFTPGLYFYSITASNKNVYSGKIVIE